MRNYSNELLTDDDDDYTDSICHDQGVRLARRVLLPVNERERERERVLPPRFLPRIFLVVTS